MEPLPKERGHGVTRSRHPEPPGASMEPLPKERGHPNIGDGIIISPGCLNGAAPEGAGSRVARCRVVPREWTPQWSRSRRSGVTSFHGNPRPPAEWPQWSRSRRSGVTGALDADDPGRGGASMEPLPKERGHVRAERPVQRGRHASMEPLPKERGHGRRRSSGRLAGCASMEPLPKERGHVDQVRRGFLLAHASMEPLPKERGHRDR